MYILMNFLFFVIIAEQVISYYYMFIPKNIQYFLTKPKLFYLHLKEIKKNNKQLTLKKITMYILRKFIFFVLIAEQVISKKNNKQLTLEK